jgi:general secretion pathway protein A
MYLEYWNLNRNPFDNVPDPNMYFSELSTVEGTVAELLFAIEEANECLAVVVGDVGLGKTMSMRMVLNELDPDKYRIAYITNPDVTFNQLLRDIVGQLYEDRCEIRSKEDLLEAFNKLLFKTSDNGEKVLIFIDEGNALRPANLEGLRLLTNMQEDEKNLFTLIIAGQPKLAQMLRDPRRANFYQRIGVFCNLEPMDSVDVVQSYIHHRMTVAGNSDPIFDSDGVEAVFTRSGGVPRLVNRLCKLSLKAAETNQLRVISGNLVNQIADRFAPLESGKKTAARKKRVSGAVASLKAEIKKFPRAVEKKQAEIEEAHSPVIQPAPRPSEKTVRPVEPAAAIASSNVAILPDVVHAHAKKKIQLMGVSQQSIIQLKDLKTSRDKLRYAGFLAARELKIHPERFEGIDIDPVRIWDDLRRAIIAAV